ncbi:ABC transporter permease [Paenibacillus hamazuiensis]|uniref:ABC transporter permease n=1 Tax=Paenibacillus hamazuiensis TaxID=2936508 RepID=UPI00200FDC19|nr:ABC transporter permease [Paenibacillus hamazuiensis]
MLQYILRRLLLMIPIVILVSIIIFFIIQLPPGDFVSRMVADMSQSGETVTSQQIAEMRATYGLDKPMLVQYYDWMKGIITKGDFGYSYSFNRPVLSIIQERLGITIFVSLITMFFTYCVAIPIGIYSAVRQYSFGDYLFSFIGFLGMATPGFLLAIILMISSYYTFGDPLLGLVSPEFLEGGWSFGKLLDLLKHMVIPIIVIGLGGTCGLIRIMRGQMLDEMNQPYVVTAQSKGLSERRILLKYPTRAAINPMVSTIGWSLESILTGSTITAIVLNLPTQGPVMYKALLSQDMYLAGAWLLFMTVLIILGTLISDILLAWLDPRIRY